MAHRRLPLWKKLCFSLVLVALTLAVIEAALRLDGYGPAVRSGLNEPIGATFKPDAFAYYAVCDRAMGFRNRPNGRYYAHAFQGHPLSTTNELGYRNGFGWSPQGTEPIVLFIGDSFTFCSEVNDDETSPSEVARLLGRRRPVRVLNAGVRGFNTVQAKRMLAECLDRYPAIRVVVYTYCGNDLYENLVPGGHYPAKAPTVVRDPATGAFREVEVEHPAVPWGECYLNWKPGKAVPYQHAVWIAWLRGHSALIHHCLRGIDYRWLPPQVPGDDHPADLPIDHAEWERWALSRGGDEIVRGLLTEMSKMCAARGATFVAVCAYTGVDPSTAQLFNDWCRQAKVEHVSLLDGFPGSPKAYIAQMTDGTTESHYGPLGTKHYAAALAPHLERYLDASSASP